MKNSRHRLKSRIMCLRKKLNRLDVVSVFEFITIVVILHTHFLVARPVAALAFTAAVEHILTSAAPIGACSLTHLAEIRLCFQIQLLQHHAVFGKYLGELPVDLHVFRAVKFMQRNITLHESIPQ